LINSDLLSDISNIDDQYNVVNLQDSKGEADGNSGILALSARIAHFGTDRQGTVAFARFVFANNRCVRISDEYIADLGERQDAFDAIVVCGNDHNRLRRFLRFYRPTLLRKIKIAVMPRSTPKERTALLNAGFDDVFDEKFDPMEVKLRIAAIYRRVHIYNTRRAVAALISPADKRRFFRDEPTAREAYLFNMMMAQPGQSVPIHRLRAPPSNKYEQVSIKSLQVYLTGLRKKLSPALHLRNDGSAGYSLHMVANADMPRQPRAQDAEA
jgi:hypothetical protein